MPEAHLFEERGRLGALVLGRFALGAAPLVGCATSAGGASPAAGPLEAAVRENDADRHRGHEDPEEEKRDKEGLHGWVRDFGESGSFACLGGRYIFFCQERLHTERGANGETRLTPQDKVGREAL